MAITIIEIIQELDGIIKAKKKLDSESEISYLSLKGLVNNLLASVDSAFPDFSGSNYLKQWMVGVGLGQLIEDSDKYNINPQQYKDAAQYKFAYNHGLYKTILPLLQLAYLYEKNGDAEEHAFKLAMIFNTADDILKYLLVKKHKNNYTVHDECLFQLPDADKKYFLFWKKLANLNNNMHKLRFRMLLPHANALMKYTNPKDQKSNINLALIEKKKIEITIIKKKYKKIDSKPDSRTTEEAKAERKLKKIELSEKLKTLQLELAKLCTGMPLDKIDVTIWSAFYEQFLDEKSMSAHRILTENGISMANQNRFNSLNRGNDDNLIPNIVLNGDQVGQSGFYIIKLDTMSDAGAARAAALGMMTNCCQHLGGGADTSVVYGIERPDSGFYVLCIGNASQPSLNDKIIAQSWVWRSGDTLCFDSIEVDRKFNNIINIAILMFQLLAHQLCHNPEYRHYNIHQCNVGDTSGISNLVGAKLPCKQVSLLTNLPIYSDARSQLILAHRDMPYLLYKNIGSNVCKEIIDQRILAWINQIMQSNVLLINNIYLHNLFIYGVLLDDKSLLSYISECFSSGVNEIFREMINSVTNYYNKLNDNQIDLELLKFNSNVDIYNQKGLTAFQIAFDAGNTDALREIVMLRPIMRGDPRLFFAIKNKDYFAIVVSQMSNEEFIATISELIADGHSILVEAFQYPDTLEYIKCRYDDNARFKKDVIDQFNKSPDDELFCEIMQRFPDSFKMILSLFDQEELEKFIHSTVRSNVNAVFINGLSRAQLCFLHYKSYKYLLELMPHNKRLPMIEDAYLSLISRDGSLLPTLRAQVYMHKFKYSDEFQRAALLEECDDSGNTIFHDLIADPELAKEMLVATPKHKRITALLKKNNNGLNPIDLIFSQWNVREAIYGLQSGRINALKTVIDFFPNGELSPLFKQALPKAIAFPDCLEVCLKYFSPDERVAVIISPDENGKTLLYYATDKVDIFDLLLNQLPASTRYDAVKDLKNLFGQNALQISWSSLNCFKLVLAAYPKDKRFEALLSEAPFAKYPWVIDIIKKHINVGVILEALSENDRFKLLKLPMNNEAIIDYMISHEIDISPLNHSSEESFVPDFIKLYKALKGSTNNPHGLFTDPAAELFVKLKASASFDEIKIVVLDYIIKYPATSITKRLLESIGVTENAENIADVLKHRWHMLDADELFQQADESALSRVCAPISQP